MQKVKSLQEHIRGAPYSAAPLEELIPIFRDIQELAKSVGLLALEAEIEYIDDDFLARTLARVIDGCDTPELTALALAECAPDDAPSTRRTLFIGSFCILLQDASPELEQRLRKFLRQRNPAAAIVRLLGEMHFPHSCRQCTQLSDPGSSRPRLLEIIDREAPWDALAYYGAALEALALEELDASYNIVSSICADEVPSFCLGVSTFSRVGRARSLHAGGSSRHSPVWLHCGT